MKIFKAIAFLLALFNLAHADMSHHEKQLVEHVITSIENGELGISKLDDAALSVRGFSSPKIRHFLNNLCTLPNTRYLEIGSWCGSTWVAALYGNNAHIKSAVAIDNWSEFDGPVDEFQANCNRFLANIPHQALSADCFNIDLASTFPKKVNVYFYDGFHSTTAQEMAFTYYDSILDDVFIAVVDDWTCSRVQEGTYSAFKKLGYQVLYQAELPGAGEYSEGDNTSWWHGLYVAVIRKPQ